MKAESSQIEKAKFVESELVAYGPISEITRQGTTVLRTPPTDSNNYS